MASRRIGVVGWTGHGNLGDEGFKAAFCSIWPSYHFDFFDHVPVEWREYDAIMVGGGDVLGKHINGLQWIDKPIAFVGVGGSIHPENRKAMERAKVVLRRDATGLEQCPDLMFGRSIICDTKKRKHITCLMNSYLSPSHNSPAWHLSAWDWFTFEFAKFLDMKAEDGYSIVFLPMCVNPIEDDSRAAAYVIDKMKYKLQVRQLHFVSEPELIYEISQSELVFSQRLHGAIFSTIVGTPFVSIAGHDKLSNFVQSIGQTCSIPYYGFSLRNLYDVKLPTKFDLLTYAEKARSQWKDISGQVDHALFG